jgi:glyoxylate utilization-related uncharacterized protein
LNVFLLLIRVLIKLLISGLCQRMKVSGYPSIIFFSKGKMYKFNQARTVEAFVNFATSEYEKVEGVDVPVETIGDSMKFSKLNVSSSTLPLSC